MYNQNNPYLASITENRLLTKSGSKKETRHLVVDFSGMNESYECGDSLGIIPSNREEDVNHLLEVIEASGEEMVKVPKVEEEIKLREALTNHLYFLAGPTKKFLKSLYERVTSKGERMQLQYWLEIGTENFQGPLPKIPYRFLWPHHIVP